MQDNDKITVHVPEKKELTPLELLRERLKVTTVQPRSSILTEEDLSILPERDRSAIMAARSRCQKRFEKRRS